MKDVEKNKNNAQLEDLIINEKIWNLLTRGYSYRDISRRLREQGVLMSHETVRAKALAMFSEKGKPQHIIETKDDEILELIEQGKSIREIYEHFQIQEMKVSYKVIKIKYIEIYRNREKQKIKEKQEAKEKQEVKEKEDIDRRNEIIFHLREQQLSYDAIAEQLKEQGIEISGETVRKICEIIYKEKGKKQPKAEKYARIDRERIFELREQQLSYDAIAVIFNKEGIPISGEKIRKICEEIYAKKGKKQPKAEKYAGIDCERIFELREQQLSYDAIAVIFNKEGIPISGEKIRKICKKIYAEKGIAEPKVKKYPMVTPEEIHKLKQQGLSFGKISRFFNEKGIGISDEEVRVRYNKRYKKINRENKKIDLKNVDKKLLREKMLELKITKGASDRQIRTMAELYGIDLEDNKVFLRQI